MGSYHVRRGLGTRDQGTGETSPSVEARQNIDTLGTIRFLKSIVSEVAPGHFEIADGVVTCKEKVVGVILSRASRRKDQGCFLRTRGNQAWTSLAA